MFFITKQKFEDTVKTAVKSSIDAAFESSDNDKVKVVVYQEQIEKLKTEKQKVTNELADLQLNKKHELRDIEHMVKLREEKQAIELERKTVALQKEFQEREMKLQTEGHSKIMAMLETGKKDLQDIYGKIIDRLPNVNVEMKR